ncbi:hypothetical protein M0805_000916 [Coniferiporia weirii]|nr:hypothetical protein M0805_000916 [Coniferiporia weirii]
MSDEATTRRQLKIKTGSVKRLFKELSMYRKETVDLRVKVDKFVAEGAEDWDIKNGNNMLNESHKVLDETSTRLKNTATELRELVDYAENNGQLVGDEALLAAKEVLQEVRTAVEGE